MTGGFAPLVIDFSNNDLVAIPDGHFDHFESHVRLEGITLNDNFIRTLPIVVSEQLLVLSLRSNQLGRLNLDDLVGVPNLASLDLRNNMITAVDGSAFPESLLNLDLRANVIRGVTISAIESLPMDVGAEMRFRHDGDFRHVPGSKHDKSTTVCKPRRLAWKMGVFNMLGGSWGCCCALGYSDFITPPSLTSERCSLTPLYAGANTSLFEYFGCVEHVASSTAVITTTAAAAASTTKSNNTEPNPNSSGSQAGTASAVVIAAAVLMGIICATIVAAWSCIRRSRSSRTDLHASAALLSKLRPCSETVTVADARIASKFVAFARKRAEARFVIEYRQLVSTASMEAFRVQFSQREIPRSSVAIGSELGRGQSGVVFSGLVASSDERMAVKARIDAGDSVVGESAVAADEALVLEALLLNGLQHPGIVKLLAVVTLTAPVMICTELMLNGDLRGFLRLCRPQIASSEVGRPGQQPGVPAKIDGPAMIAIAARLSSAMAYLETQSIVHRDVAARNVLVGARASDVKIADLGAARNVHRTSESSYSGVYVATSEHNPARWMPLEALRDARFSVKSDVFSFGVLLWEILTLGQTPWGAFPVHEFVAALEQGHRLQFPSALEQPQNPCKRTEPGEISSDGIMDLFTRKDTNLAKKVYTIAERCWASNPDKRPHFHQLAAEFAIHHTVVVAEARHLEREPLVTTEEIQHETNCADHDCSPNAVSDGDIIAEGKPLAEPHLRPTLDAGGYVADVCHDIITSAATENTCGSATKQAGADVFRRVGRMLDNDGYVADTSTSCGDIAVEVPLPESTTGRECVQAVNVNNPQVVMNSVFDDSMLADETRL
jgi:serine/threonine protein kinase